MKLTTIKSIVAAAMVAVGLSAWAATEYVETEIGKDGPKTFQLGPMEGSEGNPWKVGGTDGTDDIVEAWTNGTELVIGGAGSVTNLTAIPTDVKGGIASIAVASNGVVGAEAEAFAGLGTDTERVALTLPDGWQGAFPTNAEGEVAREGRWYGAEVALTAFPLTVRNVRAQQRWPWNGKVDVLCDMTGPAGAKDAVVTVNDGEKALTNFTAAVTIPESGVLATNLVWDAMTAGLGDDFKSDDVTVEVKIAAFVFPTKEISGVVSGAVTWHDGDVITDAVTIASDAAITVKGTVTQKAPISVSSGNVTFTGNGVLLRDSALSANMLNISGGTVNLAWITLDGAEQESEYKGIGQTGGSLTLGDGALLVRHHAAIGQGSALSVAQGTVTMNGGKIANNVGHAQGTVYIGEGASFTLNGGTVCDNTLEGSGKETNGGAGFCIDSGSFTMEGGTIERNTCSALGGGLYLSTSDSTVVRLNGGLIADNTGYKDGNIFYGDSLYAVFNATGPFLFISGNMPIKGKMCLGVPTSGQRKWPMITSHLRYTLEVYLNKGYLSSADLFEAVEDFVFTDDDLPYVAISKTTKTYYAKLSTDFKKLKMGPTVPTKTSALRVIYVANGGLGTTTDDAGYAEGNTPTVAENAFTRADFEFAGWNTKWDGSGTAYAAGSTLPALTQDVILYAQWVRNTPPTPVISAKSAAGALDLRTSIALAEGAVTIADVSYSDTAWGEATKENVTLGYTNETTGATGTLTNDLAGAGAVAVTLPKKNGDYRLTHSTGGLTSFVTFTVTGYPLGSEGNPWEIGAGVEAWVIDGAVLAKPVRGTASVAALASVTNALGAVPGTNELQVVSVDGTATNDVVMLLGDNGVAYDTLADVFAADPQPETVRLFEVKGYWVSYSGGEGALGTMATDTFLPTVPTNLTANAYEIIGYEFAGWTTNGTTKAYDDRAAGVDFAQPGETLALTALWTQVETKPTGYADLTNLIAQATLPVTLTLESDIALQPGDKVVIPAGKSVAFAGEGKFDVTATIPTLWGEVTVGEGFADDSALALFKTDKDAKAYFEDGKVVLRGRGESEDFPWVLGEGVEAWVIDGAVLAKPVRGTASVAALASVTNALGAVPGTNELQVVSADGTVTNAVVMLLGDDGMPYDTLADVFAADLMPTTVKLYEVKGANIEFNAMGGVHTNGLEVITNFCIVTYTLPEVKRDGYTLDGWYNDWKPGATKVEDGQDLLSYEPHPLYAVWTANKPTPTEGELDIPDVTNGVPVTSIAAKQYVDNTSLKHVTTPLYLKSIGQRAFMGCTSLEKLTITAARSYDDLSPVKVTVEQNAFSGCSSLDTVYIAAEIDNLGQSAFQNCAKLKKIIFMGDGRIDYGASAFYRCGYQNGTGSLKVYMSSAFQAANAALIADFKRWNTQLKIVEKVDVVPVEGGSINIGALKAENLAANNRRLAILVKTSVQGTPDPDNVDVEYATALGGPWSPLTEGTEKTANPDGTVLVEVTVPEGSSGFFRAVVK